MTPKKVQSRLPPRDNQVSKKPVTRDKFPSPLDSLRTIECEMTLLRGRFYVGRQDSSPQQTRDISPRARVDTVQFFYYAGLGLSFKMTFCQPTTVFFYVTTDSPHGAQQHVCAMAGRLVKF
jgi:hypothetical protein